MSDKHSAIFGFLSTPSARRATASCNRATYTRFDFYPRPPRGGRPACPTGCCSGRYISIHALREEGDDDSLFFGHLPSHFYPRPPRGGRRGNVCNRHRHVYFYPRPPRGGRQNCNFALAQPSHFYPRPPRGGRRQPVLLRRRGAIFLSTPSARRATLADLGCTITSEFLSTPSARRATSLFPAMLDVKVDFYPRPPRGGRQAVPLAGLEIDRISIHALREEGDMRARLCE